MRILVTGTSGYIAGRLAKQLHEQNLDVIGIDRKKALPGTQYPTIKADLDEWTQVKDLGEYDVIYHLAGQPNGNASIDIYKEDIRDNLLSTANLIKLAQQTGTKQIIYASSMAIYGEQAAFPVQENATPAPKVYYGANKLAAEYYLKIANTETLLTTSLRLFNVFGPGKALSDPNQGIVDTFVRALLRDKCFEMRGSPKRYRDFVYIDDVVAAFILCLNNKRIAGESINIASGKTHTFGELVKMITARLPFETTISYSNPSSYDLSDMHGDISKAKELLGFTPKVPFSDGLDVTVEWHRSTLES